MLTLNPKEYLQLIAKRSAQKRISHQFQLIGLEIAVLLRDTEHKSLYIKYAKEYGSGRMLSLAKDIADRRGIDNKGAYFMTVVENLRKESQTNHPTPPES
jgi:hypothetical protein